MSYDSTMIQEGRGYKIKAVPVSKSAAMMAFNTFISTIINKRIDIVKNQKEYRSGAKKDSYTFLSRQKKIISLQLERHNLQRELNELNNYFSQLEGTLDNLKYIPN